MTAQQKSRVLQAWRRFLHGGLGESQFTKALYTHLYIGVPFIAHYDQQGFYNACFRHGDDTIRFFATLRDFIEGPMSNLRNPDYDDINRALIAELNACEADLVAAARAKQKAADLAAADKLLAKHGLTRNMAALSNNQATSIGPSP